MNDISNILAKSKEFGLVSLLDHTSQVVSAIELFAQKFCWNFDSKAVLYGAVLHDLGKAHPYFQNMISIDFNDDFDYSSYKHRHEISSLAFLPAIDKKYWDVTIDMVVAHHKSIENDSKMRGIIDFDENDRNFISNHLHNWDVWKHHGIKILNFFDINVVDISLAESESAIKYAVEYCRSKPNGSSFYRGLLKSADHFASAFSFRTSEKLELIFKSPNLNKYNESKRKSELYPLSLIEHNDERPHTLVVAPTGAGKTDFLMKRTKGRIFYTLPFQASINAMWKRLQEFDPDNQDIRVLHSTSKIIVGDNIEERILQPLVGSSIKVLTPHQLAAIIFGTSGYESVMLDVMECDVILDEIHTYSDYSRSMVIEIVKTLLRLNCRIHIGTATMPSSLYNQLLKILGGEDYVFEVSLNDNVLETFNRHQIKKVESYEMIIDIVRESINNKEKLLVIFNTVKRAQEFYKQIEIQHAEIPKMLIHSRYRRKDRAELESKLTNLFDGGSNNPNAEFRPCIVVSTQVVEVSLDISFDCMITESAPLDGLIQRFGRINRRRNLDSLSSEKRMYKNVHVIKPGSNTLPYDKSIVQRSYDELPDNFELLEECMLQSKINKVFDDFELKPIDTHLIFRDGKYILKELTDNKKAILIEVLEIEGAVCILESDRENYINSKWDEKIQYEIPINYKSLHYRRNKYEQLKVGSYPFVIPQAEDEHKKYGLELIEASNII